MCFFSVCVDFGQKRGQLVSPFSDSTIRKIPYVDFGPVTEAPKPGPSHMMNTSVETTRVAANCYFMLYNKCYIYIYCIYIYIYIYIYIVYMYIYIVYIIYCIYIYKYIYICV